MARKRAPSRQQRWNDAIAEARTAFETLQTAKEEAEEKTQELADELQQKLDEIIDYLVEKRDAATDALQSLVDIREEYQEWFDNLPENLQGNSPVSEKLQAVLDIDVEPSLPDPEFEFTLELNFDVDDLESALDEAEGADLPRGFGRD